MPAAPHGRSWPPGALLERCRRIAGQALSAGSLQPIHTRSEIVADGGVDFLVRVVDSLARKDAAARRPDRPPDFDPFLPCEPSLLIGEVTPAHLVVLNKFRVLDDHLVIVTREFEEQVALLTEADFEALWTCLEEIDGLGFYNAGAVAGASERHKHLQLVPKEALAPSGLPLEAHLLAGSGTLPFARHVVRLDGSGPDRVTGLSAADAAPALERHYGDALAALYGRRAPAPLPAYNLLVTRRWMAMVPRRREHADGVSLNALAFAGALLVRDDAALARVREVGPMRLLASAGDTC